MAGTILVFIRKDGKGGVHKVCPVEHTTKKCKRPHCVPDGVAWFGQWPASELGDLRIDLKEQKQAFRRENSKWFRVKKKLALRGAAPAFKAYLQSLREEHAKKEPKFEYDPSFPSKRHFQQGVSA